jgi:hypothetical protein
VGPGLCDCREEALERLCDASRCTKRDHVATRRNQVVDGRYGVGGEITVKMSREMVQVFVVQKCSAVKMMMLICFERRMRKVRSGSGR